MTKALLEKALFISILKRTKPFWLIKHQHYERELLYLVTMLGYRIALNLYIPSQN